MTLLNSIALKIVDHMNAITWPKGHKGRLAVLMYHRVMPEKDFYRKNEVGAQEFEWQMALISERCTVLPLSEALQKLAKGELPKKAVCVTFDDGYRDNLDLALPILKRWNIPCTVFVTSAFSDDGLIWNDQIIEAIRHSKVKEIDLKELDLGVFELSSITQSVHAINAIISAIKYLPIEERMRKVKLVVKLTDATLPDNLMLTRGQIRKLHSAGVEIGAHTNSHPILNSVSDDVAYFEIEKSKQLLQDIIGGPVIGFAYPNGRPNKDYLPQHVDMVKKLGFQYAVSTAWGVARKDCDRFQIPRLLPWDNTPLKYYTRLSIEALAKRKNAALP